LVDEVDGAFDSCDLITSVTNHASAALANEEVNLDFNFIRLAQSPHNVCFQKLRVRVQRQQ